MFICVFAFESDAQGTIMDARRKQNKGQRLASLSPSDSHPSVLPLGSPDSGRGPTRRGTRKTPPNRLAVTGQCFAFVIEGIKNGKQFRYREQVLYLLRQV